MGASALWLGLIDQLAASYPQAINTSLEQLLTRYKEIDQQISIIWKDQGQHAFLHHLNALFAYEPLPLEAQVNF